MIPRPQSCTLEPLLRRCDRSGAAVGFNGAWLAFTGRSHAASAGDAWLVDVHAQDRARCAAIHAEMLPSQAPYTLDYRLCHAEHGHRWLMEQSTPMLTLAGAFDGYAHHCMDVHDRTELGDTLAGRVGSLRSAARHHAAFAAALARELDRLPLPRARLALELMAQLDNRALSATPVRQALSAWLDEAARQARNALPTDMAAITAAAPAGGHAVHLDSALLGPVIAHGLVCAALSAAPGGRVQLRAAATQRRVRVDLPGSAHASASILLQRAVSLHSGASWVQAEGRIGFELPLSNGP